MKRQRDLALNMAVNYLRFIVFIAVTFVITPVIAGGLGQDGFGLWNLTWSTVGLLELIDLGLRTGVVKWVADARGRGDVAARNELVATHLVVFLALSVAAVAVVGVASTFYADALDIPLEHRGEATTLLWIVATHSVFLALPLGIFHGILFGEQRIWVINLVQLVTNVLYAAVVWRYLGDGGTIVGLAWISLGQMLLESLALAVLAFALVPGLRFPLRSVKLARLRQVFAFSSAMLVINVANLILLKTDPLIVKLVLPLSAVAVYGLALKIAVNFYFLIKQLVNVLAPFLAEAKGEGDDGLIRATLATGSRYALALAASLALGGSLLATPLVTLWVGEDYAGAAPVLVLLLAGTTLGVPPMVAGAVLGMTGHHGVAARFAFISAGVNVAVSLLLVGPLGLPGVALGTLVTIALVDNGLMMRKACDLYGLSFARLWGGMAASLAAPLAAQALVTWGMKSLLPPRTVYQAMALAVPGGLTFAALYFLVGMDADERARVLSFARRRSQRA